MQAITTVTGLAMCIDVYSSVFAPCTSVSFGTVSFLSIYIEALPSAYFLWFLMYL